MPDGSAYPARPSPCAGAEGEGGPRTRTPPPGGAGRRPGRRPAVGGKHGWCTGFSCAPPPRPDGRNHAHRPTFSAPRGAEAGECGPGYA
ncbi:hypothetical protein SHJG_8124 [Streptomyces hygroscopicus subsp. jinggangensis 5008]|nr:hypothetical protein SHJG_8124 [Streptomyces hygroscopicus subsp. jinggangensis 5008]AGF67548.1 hypothetical protein SHJGH_7886 [Streptomyces hygroscopicus subsp. jinggangensis TL01]